MYLSGRAVFTSSDMREDEKRGPLVEGSMFLLPVAAAEEDHMLAGLTRKRATDTAR